MPRMQPPLKDQECNGTLLPEAVVRADDKAAYSAPPPSLIIGFFGHDSQESTVIKRAQSFTAQGSELIGFMFKRLRDRSARTPDWQNIDLGTTTDMNYLKRLWNLSSGLLTVLKNRASLRRCTVLYARNIDMLLMAWVAKRLLHSKALLVYEALDIQHLFIGQRAHNKLMRAIERRLLCAADLLVVSSPDHMSHYFHAVQNYRGDWFLLENKISPHQLLPGQLKNRRDPPAATPWVIGWFGVLKGRRSLDMLSHLARQLPDTVEIYIRGIAGGHDVPLESIERACATHPNMRYGGPYKSPIDLPELYGNVHFTWAGDFLDAGSNSDWCLANRIYEGGLFSSVALALEETATGRMIKQHKLGFTLCEPYEDQLVDFFRSLTPNTYQEAKQLVEHAPSSLFVDRTDTANLVRKMHSLGSRKYPDAFTQSQRSSL